MHFCTAFLEVRTTRRKGRGVFATRFIAAGARILKLEGQKCSGRDIPAEAMAMQIDDDLWLCSDGTLLDDCINHACDPNCGFVHNDPILYALRDIPPGEELSWDYSTSIAEAGWSLECLCESKHCRGLILPFGELTSQQRTRLAPIALRYLWKHMEPARPGGREP